MSKKEEIIDFGELGKWSKSTLDAQKKQDYVWGSIPMGYIVKNVEDLYESINRDIVSKLTRFNVKPNRRSTILSLATSFAQIREVKDRQATLDKNYWKYRNLINSD